MIPRSPARGRGRALPFPFALALALALVTAPSARGEEPPAAAPAAEGEAPAAPGHANRAAGPEEAGPVAPEEIVIVGRRSRTQARQDPTAAATVIEAQRFAGEAKGVAELVATAPGVAVSDYGGLGHYSSISIRGSNPNGVLVLLDGLPLNGATGEGVDLSSIPRQWIDRIEVVRGPEGALYGAGALGGVVHVATRSGAGGASAESTTGSFDTYSAAAEARVGDRDAWLLVAATGESSGGAFPYLFDPEPAAEGNALVPSVRDNAAVLRGGVLVKGATAWRGRRVDGLLQLSGGRRELPGWPYKLTPEDWQRDARALAAVRMVASAPAPGLTLAARATARGERFDVRGTALESQRGGAAAVDLEVGLEHRGGSLQARASAGAEALSGEGLRGTHGRPTLSAAISEDLLVGGARIAPAVRAERVGDFAGVSAKLGASVPLRRGLAIRASGGRTFRAPSFAELYLEQGMVAPNPDLRPEEGLGADASLVAEGARGFATLGGHATVYRDIIFYQPAGLLGLKPFNSGRALVTGLEAEAASAPVTSLGLSAQGAYSLLATETLRGDAATLGKELPRRPRHRVFARLSADPGPAGVHVELHHVSRQFADARNASVVPATTVWNAGGWVRVLSRPYLRAHLEIRNLADDRTLLDPLSNPLPGRTVLLTVRLEPSPPSPRNP